MRIFRIAVTAASFAALASGPASAGPREVAPLPAAECQKIADVFSKRLKGMAVAVSETGDPADIIDRLSVSGTGCALSGTKAASSMPRNYFFDTLSEPYFKGWDQVLPAAADGPNGGTFGWSKGPVVVVYDVHVGVPEALCKTARNFDACEEKNWKQAVYTLKANAFRFVDGGPITDKDFKQ